jgi:hypothetical protein
MLYWVNFSAQRTVSTLAVRQYDGTLKLNLLYGRVLFVYIPMPYDPFDVSENEMSVS